MLRALDLQQSLHGSGQSSVYLSTRETIAHVVPAPGIPFYSPRLLLAGDRVADRIMPLPYKSSLEFLESMNMENSAAATGLERSVFIPIPKKGNPKECSNYCTIALISHTSKVMLKIVQARLQQYVNRELPDVQAGFRKGTGTRDQIASICWIIKNTTEFQKNIYFCFIDYAKDFDCVDHNKLWRILKEMGIPDHLTCLLRNL